MTTEPPMWGDLDIITDLLSNEIARMKTQLPAREHTEIDSRHQTITTALDELDGIADLIGKTWL